MDRNKLKVLREVGYTIAPSCALCKHSNLTEDGWGNCDRYSFMHEKRGVEMAMSINATGRCRDGYEPLIGAPIHFGTFAEFLQ